jgi:hypothetical protein
MIIYLKTKKPAESLRFFRDPWFRMVELTCVVAADMTGFKQIMIRKKISL